MFRQFNNFYIPPDSESGSAVADKPTIGKEEVIDFLGSDDKEEVIELPSNEKKEEGKEEEKVEEVDELKEIEEELEEPDEDKLELTTPVPRREILKKYPKVFEDFPYLEKAYYREQQFTKLFPNPSDAQEVIEKAETLDKFEKDITDGNIELVLKAAKDASPKGFTKIADDYLTSLAKVDEKAYHHVLGNVIKHLISSMVSEGKRSGTDVLNNAASIVNQYVFGTTEYTPPNKLHKEDDKESDNKISEKERAFIQKQFNVARNDLNSKVNSIIKNTISSNIDPKESMSDYVRNAASRDVFDTLIELIEKDNRFKVLTDNLWERAFKNDFDQNMLNKIKDAYIAKARTLLPSVIKKARNDALRGSTKKLVDGNKEEKDDNKRKPNPPTNRPKEGKVIPEKMSTLEFLMSED